MRRLFRILLILAGCWLAIVACSVIFMPVLVNSRISGPYRLPFAANEPLTEEAAIELTKQALILNGKGTAMTMRPKSFRHKPGAGDENIFARNTQDPNQGYVLWVIAKDGRVSDYSVEILRDGDAVVCTVTRNF